MIFQSTFKALKPDDFAFYLMQMTYGYIWICMPNNCHALVFITLNG